MTDVERALSEAMEYLDGLPMAGAGVPRASTIEFWQGLSERASERAEIVQEELDEHGESAPPGDPGSLSGDEDDEDDEDDDES